MSIKLIPAIDLIDGQCVRLTKGDFANKKVYNSDPLKQARIFEEAGIEHLHLVDLSGAQAGKPMHSGVLEKICQGTNLKVDFGGGIRSEQHIREILDRGAKQVNLGTLLIKKMEQAPEWIARYGAESLIASVDVLENKVKISGWQEDSGLEIFSVIEKLLKSGFQYFTVTDIDRDGTLGEPSYQLYKELLDRFPGIKLNASGGVSEQEQLIKLDLIGCCGAIVGKAIYEGNIKFSS
ncbi:MAG: 1-(5-phosphoribosyl)-5-[(5-phosphoribosylamino)methylideneamino]imidazole-4-carboxamide isomerase [Bacteroides sp.]|jgi:phosphoribosylformimino-5-aminoimidazole carboxamide ribotide isomerase|nr:1-(5-phosphoribosyl)-5-[(5-phosphoribosylamino)methylideneamino]imidazole-4-carboxamide isomerase [Bacteroides sp.]